MTEEEKIRQLESLLEHARDMAGDGETESENIWANDVEALEWAIEKLGGGKR